MAGIDEIWLWTGGAIVAFVALGVGAFFAVRLLWRRAVRRALVSLVSRREAVLASRRTLEAVMRHLADEDDETLQQFATHPESEDRRALQEVAQRMQILVEELDTEPLPRPLVPVAEGLADAAFVIRDESARVGDSADSSQVFESLSQIDLTRVASVFDAAEMRVKVACERYHLDETSVYGGGLYI